MFISLSSLFTTLISVSITSVFGDLFYVNAGISIRLYYIVLNTTVECVQSITGYTNSMN